MERNGLEDKPLSNWIINSVKTETADEIFQYPITTNIRIFCTYFDLHLENVGQFDKTVTSAYTDWDLART